MPSPALAATDPAAAFIARWANVPASERATAQSFLNELCDLIEVPRPTGTPDYQFECPVVFTQPDGKRTTKFMDLYRRGCFVLESKKYAPKTEPAELAPAAKKTQTVRGSEAWDRAMIVAHGQAERYARHLSADEPNPVFLLVVDVGHVIELYADFTQNGKAYLPFPDARANRIRLTDLADASVRAKLRAVWLDARSLDPAKIAAQVTREVAAHLAELAKLFEKKHDPATVAAFLSRCLFCMFAEDVELLPKDSFTQLLESVKGDPGAAVPLLKGLFAEMNSGGYSLALRKTLLHFNGGLFAESTVLPLNGTQLGLLIAAARQDWKHVEPAIFGTLLERALNPAERHKLGAHYTPRAYVERLVLPAVVEPLREEWAAVRTAAVTLATRGDLKAAIRETRAFHHRLCAVRVLDPACGSGNFLYVTLEHLKRLEGEVLQLIESFGENMRLDLGGETVDPHQFLGIEINPRAATVAELVLWIGYLQWHHRNRGSTEWPEPVLRAFKNIECRDAVLAYDDKGFAKDEQGKVRFVWNRRTKTDPNTGRQVPDLQATTALETFVNPRPSEWPQADFIVGNPPFLGDKVMRQSLGEGYVETLRAAYPDVPESADFVMYWWHKAAELTLDGKCRRFGFITTNSIKQTFNRRVVRRALLGGISLRYAIPDHPWVDTADGAAVRIAMSVGALSYELPEPGMLSEPPPPDPSAFEGELFVVKSEVPKEDGSEDVIFSRYVGRISSDFSIGADVSATVALKANDGVSVNGMMLAGRGFVLTKEEAVALGLGKIRGVEKVIRPIINGRDLTETARGLFVIDLAGYQLEEARAKFPSIYQVLVTRVKPERDSNARAKLKNDWWVFGEPRKTLRAALAGLPCYIATVETAKHRVFQFVATQIVPEHKLVAIALADAFHLGVLSSRFHAAYALAAGSTLEDRPVYPKSRCFDPFPFPDCTEKQKEKIRKLAEELDAHRKRAQQQHGLGLTDIYNVLEKLRANEPLTAKDKALHDAALVSTLKQLHDDLDAAVADAYGWLWPLTDAEILEKVVALNTARAAEEAKGFVRWLRPDYQKPLFASQDQSSLGLDDGTPRQPKTAKPKKAGKTAWPKTIADRAKAVETALAQSGHPVTAAELTKQFSRAKPADVQEILETLAALGRARPGDQRGTFVR